MSWRQNLPREDLVTRPVSDPEKLPDFLDGVDSLGFETEDDDEEDENPRPAPRGSSLHPGARQPDAVVVPSLERSAAKLVHRLYGKHRASRKRANSDLDKDLSKDDSYTDAETSDDEEEIDRSTFHRVLSRQISLRRGLSTVSKADEGGDDLLDEFDPGVIGHTRNEDDFNHFREQFIQEHNEEPSLSDIEHFYHTTAFWRKRHCLLRLAKAFLRFGAPMHRLENIMKAARAALEIPSANFIVLPGVMLVVFGDGDARGTEIVLVQVSSALDLGRLSATFKIYKELTHGEIGAREGGYRLGQLLDKKSKPFWGRITRCCFSAILSFLVCPMAFGGSILDASIAGCFGFIVTALALFAASHSKVFSVVFEIFAVIIVSFTSTALSSIKNSRYFCYSAISTAGVVSLLPGFLVLASSQELAAKNALSGSMKMIYAVVYSLFLGYSLDLGSHLWLLMDQAELKLKAEATKALNPSNTVTGFFTTVQNGTLPWAKGAFTFQPPWIEIDPAQNHFMYGSTCHRAPEDPWYLQPWPWQLLFILVPIYAFFSSLKNLQPLRRRRHEMLPLVVMVLIACISYGVNRLARLALTRTDSVTAVAAVTVGLLGNMYSRIFKGYAYPAMVPGVLFLVPSGLTAINNEDFAGSSITLRIIQVCTGVSVGLSLSNYFVYAVTAFLPKWMGGQPSKKQAVFAF